MGLKEYHAEVQETADSPPVGITLLTSEDIAQLPRGQAEEHFAQLLSQFRLRPEIQLFEVGTFSSYVTPPSGASLLGKNVVLEARLPYCLSLPDGLITEVIVPDSGIRARVRVRKVWTDLAEGSTDLDAYADDRLLYLGNFEIQTPQFPQPPEHGPWPRLSGRNVEFEKDTRGRLRYTHIRIAFDMDQGSLDSEHNESARRDALRQATEIGLQVINYFLDVYRYVTGETHPERLSLPIVTLVYFADCNLVFEGVVISHGLRSAVANRPGTEIDRLLQMVSAGDRPDRHELLLLSARAALDRRELLIAVIASFQALEIFLENKLREGYGKQGLDDPTITQLLNGTHRTKDRLQKLCREVTGKSVADDSQFWADWLADCNRKRNAVIHHNAPITHAEAERVVSLCEECVRRIKALPWS